MRDYLEFEKPLREVEEKIEKLAASGGTKAGVQDEIRKLRMKLAQLEHELYAKLTATGHSAMTEPLSAASLVSTIGRSWSSGTKRAKLSRNECSGTSGCPTRKAIGRPCA